MPPRDRLYALECALAADSIGVHEQHHDPDRIPRILRELRPLVPEIGARLRPDAPDRFEIYRGVSADSPGQATTRARRPFWVSTFTYAAYWGHFWQAARTLEHLHGKWPDMGPIPATPENAFVATATVSRAGVLLARSVERHGAHHVEVVIDPAQLDHLTVTPVHEPVSAKRVRALLDAGAKRGTLSDRKRGKEARPA